ATGLKAAVSGAWGDEDFTGKMLGAYQIVSRLGRSRWGTVYAAVQVAINRPVGLKVLDRAYQNDPSMRARFIGDARAKANVQHPSLLSVFEAGEAAGRIFYTHEYVEGQNLHELRVSGDKIDERTALKILRVVGEGLAYLHTHNIAHTRLTEMNIYLSADGQPRLTNLAIQHAEEQFSQEEEI